VKPGERLVQVVKEKGITQKELAKKLNVSASTVSDWGSGKTEPKGSNLIKAAEIRSRSVKTGSKPWSFQKPSAASWLMKLSK
jgi:transcriptional regulator with XRE-family HTH domain